MSEGELLLLQDPTQGIAKMISGWQLDAKEWTKRDKINRSYLAHTFYEEVAVPEKFEQADISSDGRYLLLNQGLETSMLYEMREKKWTDVLDLVGATTHDFNHLAFSKDNQYVLSAGLDHKLNLWSTQGDGQLEGEYRPSSKVNFQCAAVSKDNQYLVGGTDKGMIFLWKRNQPEKFDTIAIGNEEIPILAIEIHPNEEQILVLSSKAVSAVRFDGTLLFQKRIDTENGFSGKLALSTDASKLAYISGRTLEIYNWKDDSTTTIPHELILDKQSSFRHLCFSNDGNLLFVADNQQGYLLSASKNQASVFRSLKSDKGIVTNATFSKDDQQLYTIHQEQQQILKWTIPYDAPQLLSIRSDSTCEVAQNSPVKAAYTTEGDNIVLAYRYGALLKYYLTSDDCQVLAGHENSDGLRDMIMSPNGQYVLSWHDLGFGEALYLWDKNKQTAAIQIDMQGLIADDAYLQTLAFSPTQSLVLIGTDQNAFLYDYIKQEKQMDISLEGIQKGVFSADGNSILLVTNEGELKTWQEATNTLETYENIRGATALAALEENRFASASNDTIFICEIGIVPTTIPLQKPGVSVNEIHYLAASQELLLLSVFEGKSNIEIWSIEGYPCRQLLSLDASINSLTLSPDKSRIVAVSEEGQLYFWDNNYPNIKRYLERFDK